MKNAVIPCAFCLLILIALSPAAGSAVGNASVTITGPATLKYTIGEDTIALSRTNTAANTTYLFLSGPNLDTNGSQIQKDWPSRYPVTDGDASTFQEAGVGQDSTWSYTWDTHDVAMDSGVYTVYAASTPRDIPHINGTCSARLSLIMLPPEDRNMPLVKIAPQQNQKYFIGDDAITFSGINTASNTTYLFITGPNLDPAGSQIQSSHPGQSPVIDGNASAFQAVSVGPDAAWSYTWNTRTVLIDAGLYTVVAASAPRNLSHINDTHYAKLDFVMKRPANIDSPNGNLSEPSVVTKGNTVTISGTATGSPGSNVAIWIIGAPGSGTAGYADQVVVRPDATGSYSLDLDRAATSLQDGAFHVVVQHPGKNDLLDIFVENNSAAGAKDAWVINRMLTDTENANGTRIFKIRGAGSLQGNDAFEALVQVFEDPAVDDTIVIAPLPAVIATGSGENGTPEIPKTLPGGQDNTPGGSGSLLDRIGSFFFGFLKGN
jgi:hypothetical protein